MERKTLLLTGRDVSDLLTMDVCIAAVEGAFRAHADGKTIPPGVLGDDEVIVFDSTGTALQDVAAAAVVYEKALATGRGTALTL